MAERITTAYDAASVFSSASQRRQRGSQSSTAERSVNKILTPDPRRRPRARPNLRRKAPSSGGGLVGSRSFWRAARVWAVESAQRNVVIAFGFNLLVAGRASALCYRGRSLLEGSSRLAGGAAVSMVGWYGKRNWRRESEHHAKGNADHERETKQQHANDPQQEQNAR